LGNNQIRRTNNKGIQKADRCRERKANMQRIMNHPKQQIRQLLSQDHRKGTTMKNILLASLAAGALASAALGLAGIATAAPSGAPSVDATVSQLRAQGFQVIVNRLGAGSVDQCTLSAVRPGQTFTRTDSGVPGAADDLVTTVTNKTVYVDVSC
jgi:hypothetical protein